MILNPEYLGATSVPLIFGFIDLQKPGFKRCHFMCLFVSRNIEKDPVCKKCSNNLKTYGQVRSEYKNTINLTKKVVSYRSENSNLAALFVF